MSASLQSFISQLFGKEDLSDCTIEFYCNGVSTSVATVSPTGDAQASSNQENLAVKAGDSPEEPLSKRQRLMDAPDDAAGVDASDVQAPQRPNGSQVPSQDDDVPCQRVTVGAPLPAHLLALCGCSPRFRAQVERWTQDQLPGSKPVLRVPLESAEALPQAMSALRYAYTAKITDSNNATKLLYVRRQAVYLQVEGCKEACDVALTDRITVSPAPQGSTGALAGVLEVFTARELLPDPTEEPGAFSSIMHACRQQLVGHSGSGKIEGPVREGTPSLGELLGWAFGDAPSVLSDPKTRRQMEQLSPAAMEALLRSSTLATDDESSVLLMLAVWLQVNKDTPEDVRKRLCRLLRLSQLSSVYLQVIVPTLPWFPISTAEHRFLCLYAAATVKHRARMAQQAPGSYDCSSPWYSAPARPSSTTSSRRYDWHIDQDKLKEKLLASDTQMVWLEGSFINGTTRVTSLGFEWHPSVKLTKGSDTAGVYLSARLPSALRSSLPVSEQPKIPVPPGAARLAVMGRLAGGNSGEMWDLTYNEDYVSISWGWGVPKALALSQEPGGQGSGETDPLAAWSAYLQDGRISGVLEWEAAK